MGKKKAAKGFTGEKKAVTKKVEKPKKATAKKSTKTAKTVKVVKPVKTAKKKSLYDHAMEKIANAPIPPAPSPIVQSLPPFESLTKNEKIALCKEHGLPLMILKAKYEAGEL